MNMKSKIKVAKAIAYLEQQEIFHECYDIEEMVVDEVVAEYGLLTHYNKEESELLRSYLLGKAELAEVGEAVRWVMEKDNKSCFIYQTSQLKRFRMGQVVFTFESP